MEAAIKRDELIALGGVTRQLDCAFDGFRAGIAKEHFLGFFSRHGGDEPLGELRHVVVIKIRSGNVNQFRGLFLNGFHDFRMTVPG